MGGRAWSFKCLRHSCATWIRHSTDVPEDKIAQFLGHATRTITGGYVHFRPRDFLPVVEALDRMESGPVSAPETGSQVAG